MPTAVGDILDLLWTVHDRKKKSRMRKKSIQASKEHIACIWEAAADVTDMRLLQALLREPSVDRLAGEVNKHGMSILHVAAQSNNSRFLQFFIKQQDVSSQQGFSCNLETMMVGCFIIPMGVLWLMCKFFPC